MVKYNKKNAAQKKSTGPSKKAGKAPPVKAKPVQSKILAPPIGGGPYSFRTSTKAAKLRREAAAAKAYCFATTDCQATMKTIDDNDDRKTQKLKDHFQALYLHKNHYKNRLDSEGCPAHKAKITEAKGEISATLYMLRNYPNHHLAHGFAPGTGFDQLWTVRDQAGTITEVMIVEAKGEGAGLSTGADKGDQMDNRWVTNSVEQMWGMSGEAKELKDALIAGLKGANPPVIRGAVIGIQGGTTQEMPLPAGARFPQNGVYNGSYEQ